MWTPRARGSILDAGRMERSSVTHSRDEAERLVNELFGVPEGTPFIQEGPNRVPENPNASPEWMSKPTLANLQAALKATSTITDLFKLANDDTFKASVATLPPDSVKALRAVYHDHRTFVDGKVKLESFDGQVVNIVGIDWWHSDQYDADGVSLHIRSEREPEKKVKALTSSAPVVTFANRLRDVPTEAKPLRVMLSLVPVRDPERAARGQKIWSVKQMPPAREMGSDGNVPF